MKHNRALLRAALAFAIAGVSSAAYAYSETTHAARLTFPPNSGCIRQESSLIHAGASDPLTLVTQVTMPGRTRVSPEQCNSDWPAGSTTIMTVQPAEYLIKLINTNNPALGYFICQQPFIPPQILVPEINLSTTYPSAPCGAGYYALVSCLNTLGSATATPSGPVLGSYAASFFFPARDCNVSPFYHPVGVGNNVTPGPAVVL